MKIQVNEIIKKYSVLPQLIKLQNDIFDIDENYEKYLKLKQEAIKTQQCFVCHNFNNYDFICSFIQSKYPLKLSNDFQESALQIQEDLAIHCLDWFAAGHICFPSGWLPEEKIGKSFEEIHQPVPGMKSKKLVEAMIFSGPFERYVWSVVFENSINGHPNNPKKQFIDSFWVKIERQVTFGFPEQKMALFTIRQYLFPETEIDKNILYNSLSQMTEAEKKYKNINNEFLLSLK